MRHIFLARWLVLMIPTLTMWALDMKIPGSNTVGNLISKVKDSSITDNR